MDFLWKGLLTQTFFNKTTEKSFLRYILIGLASWPSQTLSQSEKSNIKLHRRMRLCSSMALGAIHGWRIFNRFWRSKG